MTKPKLAPPGVRGMSIQVGWTVESIQRLEKRFRNVWNWLDSIGAADWNRVHGLATHFHPDYVFDQRTRQQLPGLAPGAAVFFQMERGEYKPDWLKACAPTLAKMMPKQFRGKGSPDKYALATVFLAANLAAHEYERLDAAMEERPRDYERIARHLYFFERFDRLFCHIGTNKPPAYEINLGKRREAADRASAALAFHLARQKATPGRKISPRESAIAFAGGVAKPSFRGDYANLRSALKEATSKRAS